jgi:PAS domain-containing protein
MACAETPMWMVDPSTFRFASCNEAAAILFGYPREQLATMSVFAVLAPEDVERLRDALTARPLAGDGGKWTVVLRCGTRVRIHTRFHFTEVARQRQQFTFVSDVYGHPTIPDGPTPGIGAAAAR